MRVTGSWQSSIRVPWSSESKPPDQRREGNHGSAFRSPSAKSTRRTRPPRQRALRARRQHRPDPGQHGGRSRLRPALQRRRTDDDTTTGEVLRSMGYAFVEGSTLIVEIEDSPCALGDLTTRLANGGVALKGCCVVGRRDGRAEWSLSVDNEELGREVLGLPTIHRLVEAAPRQ